MNTINARTILLLNKPIWSLVLLVGLFLFSSAPFAQEWNEGSHDVLVGDYNSDGTPDLYIKAKLQIQPIDIPYDITINLPLSGQIHDILLLSKTGGDFETIYNPALSELNNVTWSASDYSQTVADQNGDGIKDLLLVSDGDGHTVLLQGTAGKQAPKLGVVTHTTPGTTTLAKRSAVDTQMGNNNSLDNGHYVGVINSSFSVTASGKPSYTMPLTLVPASAQITPSMALTYSGIANNSTLGVGWFIDGLSTITRCPTTIVQDEYINAVNYNSSDKFCLNGERLILVDGNYGADQSEYRTAHESYSKIIAYGNTAGGPTSFKVWRADGRIEEYGNSTDSRQVNQTTGAVYRWGINKLSDRQTNYAQYQYINNSTSGRFQIQQIAYGGNETTALTPFAKLVFNYESRTDVSTSHANGLVKTIDQRVNRIETFFNSQRIRYYQLHYEYADLSQRSRLIKLDHCLDDGKCLKPTTFQWDTTTSGYDFVANSQQQQSVNNLTTYSDIQYHSADVNGDGKNDLIQTWRNVNELGIRLLLANNDGDGFTEASTLSENGYAAANLIDEGKATYQYLTGDVNGDGKSDLIWVAHHNDTVYRTIYLANSNGQGFTSQGYQTDSRVEYDSYLHSQHHVSDVDGDGRSDLVWTYVFNQSIGRVTYLSRHSGANIGFFKSSFDIDNQYPAEQLTDVQHQLGDTNGDGKSDLVLTFTLGDDFFRVIYLANAAGSGFEKISQQTLKGTPFTSYTQVSSHLVDINADGKSDLVISYNEHDTFYRQLFLSSPQGTSFNYLKTEINDLSGLGVNSMTRQAYHSSDINGDGKTDLIFTYNNTNQFGWLLFKANVTGDGYTYLKQGSISANATDTDHHYFLDDVNGDGKSDLVWAYRNLDLLKYHSLVLPKSHTDHIETFTDGFNNQTKIEYQYLADLSSGIYNKASGATYPVRDDNGLSYVVSAVDSSNGIGGFNRMEYQYAGARTHLTGRGFLGFKQRQVINKQTDFVTTEHYLQDWPFIGELSWNRTTNADDPVEEAYNHWQSSKVNYGNGQSTDFVSLKDSAQIQHEINDNGHLQATVTQWDYDNWGNTSNINKTTGIGFSGNINTSFNPDGSFTKANLSGWQQQKQTQRTFSNDETNWRIGFVSSQDITYSAPGATDVSESSSYTPYNANSLLLRDESHYIGSSVSYKKTYARDDYGNITSITLTGDDIEGGDIVPQVTTFGPYQYGLYADELKNSLDHTTRFQYDPGIGKQTQVEDPNGQVVDTRYDDFGEEVYSKDIDGTDHQTNFAFCDTNCPTLAVFYSVSTSTHDYQPGYKVSPVTTYYDSFYRILRTETPGLNGQIIVTDKQYDALGRIARTSQPYFKGDTPLWHQYQYDKVDRVKQLDSADGGVIAYNYASDSSFGRKVTSSVTIKNTIGNTLSTINSSKITDAQNRLRKTIDGDSKVTLMQYTARGDLNWAMVNNDSKTVFQIEYDAAGNRTRLIDPDVGERLYAYDALGHLRKVIQNPGSDNVTSSETQYDVLGRMISRTDTDDTDSKTGQWQYDTAANGIGLLASQTGDDFYQQYIYDGFSRLQQVNTTLDTQPIRSMNYQYDNFGRQKGKHFPSGLKIDYQYNGNGYQHLISDSDNSTIYWQAQNNDALGNITQEQYANGVQSQRTYQPANGHLNQINTSKGSYKIQDLVYQFDTAGNLRSRRSASSYQPEENILESFDYDALYRLKKATTTGLNSGTRTEDYNYDALGNVTYKSDISDIDGFVYGENGAGVHAVTKVTKGDSTTVYQYDERGNMIKSGDRNLTYTVFNKPETISAPGVSTLLSYAPDRRRFRQQTTDDGNSTDTYYYDGGSFEVVQQDSITRYKSYISDFMIHTLVDNASEGQGIEIAYTHRDSLGSVESITYAGEQHNERMLFAPFGQRRKADWENADSSFMDSLREKTFQTTSRGFTNHEHLDATGFIHMNGRIYNPAIGRFMSPDPYIQLPEFSQSFNRYSYVMNNPLSHTDETGEFVPLVVWGVTAAWKAYNIYETVETAKENYDIITDDNASTKAKTEAVLDVATDALGLKKVKKAVNAIDKKLDSPNKMVPSKELPGSSTGPSNTGKSSKTKSQSESSESAKATGTKDANTTKKEDVKDTSGSKDGNIVAKSVSQKPIIIGENMKRVKEYADKTGGHAYQPWKNDDPFDYDLGMKRNERWIKDQVRKGREVIDIGPDFQRRAAKGTRSDFYEMERRNVKGYDNHKKVFERNGSEGGVKDLDF